MRICSLWMMWRSTLYILICHPCLSLCWGVYLDLNFLIRPLCCCWILMNSLYVWGMSSSKNVLHFLIGNVSISLLLLMGIFAEFIVVGWQLFSFCLSVFLHSAQVPVGITGNLGVIWQSSVSATCFLSGCLGSLPLPLVLFWLILTCLGTFYFLGLCSDRMCVVIVGIATITSRTS